GDFLEERRKLIAQNINEFLEELLDKEEEPAEVKGETSWSEFFKKGENNFVEFKSTLVYDLRQKKPMKYIEHNIAKAIAAFLNSEGGQLFVGVDDDGNVLGLEQDFSLSGEKGEKDGFLLKFDNIIRDYLGNE